MAHLRVIDWVAGLAIIVAATTGWPAGAASQAEQGTVTSRESATDGVTSTRRVLRQRIPLGQQETFVLVRPGEGETRLRLGISPERPAALWDAPTRAAWDLQRALVDVTGDGTAREVEWGSNDRWIPRVDGRPGSQRLTWTDTWGDEGQLRLYSYDHGVEQPTVAWESDVERGTYSPYSLVGDFDDDGRPDVAVSRMGGISVFDVTTGRRKAVLDYRSGHHRHYGFFGAYPDDGGGGTLFVVIGDFSGHVDVVSYRGGELKPLWMALYDPQSEQGIDRRYTINRVPPEPVVRIDGRCLILTSVFNIGGDQQWHALGYDLLTGRVALDLPRHYVSGAADVDGDGSAELFCQVLPSRAEPTYAPLELIRIADGRPHVTWQADSGRWSLHVSANQPLDRWWGQTLGNQTPALGRTPAGTEFFVSRPLPRGGERVEAWRVVNKGQPPNKTWTAEAGGRSEVEVCAVGPDQSQALVVTRSRGRASLHVKGADAEVVAARPRGGAAPSIALARDRDGRPWVVAADTSRQVNLMSFDGTRWRAVRRFPGRPMTTQGEWAPRGLATGDVDGDGGEEALFAQEGPNGCARLVAMGLDGQERWHRDFPGFSGRLRAWNMGGITCWIAGRFRSRNRYDVAVSLRRSIMHSDETYLLDGATGAIVWHRDVLEVKDPPHTRGFGGEVMAAADVDGDGLDELVLCYPAELSVTDGETGKVDAVYNMGPVPAAEMPGNLWVIGGVPLVADLDGDGRLEIAWTQNRALLSAFRLEDGNLKMIWHGERDQGTTAESAVVRLRSGDCVIGTAGFPDGFRAVNGKDGTTRWVAPVTEAPVSNTIAIDIDQDGEAEFVFAAGSRLYAHEAGAATQLWAFDLPASASQVISVPGAAGGILMVTTTAGDLLMLALD